MGATLLFLTVTPTNSIPISTKITKKFDLGKSPFCLSSVSRAESRTFNTTVFSTPLLSFPNFRYHGLCSVMGSSSSSYSPKSSTRLYVSGLSFRTTEDSLRNAFQKFGQLVEVNLVMDKIANRPRGFAFLHYATDEESQKAIEGMHGKFLDGRVIFVEVAKPRSELRRQSPKQNPTRY